jgi:hypothetical protein
MYCTRIILLFILNLYRPHLSPYLNHFGDKTLLDKTHQNDPYRPIQKDPLCQLK